MINTPDGPGVRLEWPIGATKHFRERHDASSENETSHYVAVIAVRFASGEVRFYTEDVLS